MVGGARLAVALVLVTSVEGMGLTRRVLGRAGLAGLAAPLAGWSPAGAPVLAAAIDARELLADVPIFAITNARGAPYLTERNADGLRTGAFYLSPRDALGDLENVRAFDPKASLSILPLGTIWADIPKSAAEAQKLAAEADAPDAGTSTDMRLFTIRTISDEEEMVASVFGSKRLPIGTIPVYWDPALLIQPDGAAEAQRPYFFRLKDLQETIQASGSGRKPEPRVDNLVDVVNSATRAGATRALPLFYVASDAAAVVERTGLSAGDGGGQGGGSASNQSSEEAKMQRLIDLCLTVPFKAS